MAQMKNRAVMMVNLSALVSSTFTSGVFTLRSTLTPLV